MTPAPTSAALEVAAREIIESGRRGGADWNDHQVSALMEHIVAIFHKHNLQPAPEARERPPEGKELPKRCPECGSTRIYGKFDPDVGLWLECENCEHNWSECKAITAACAERDAAIAALGKKCTSLEADREYNAGLVRERDAQLDRWAKALCELWNAQGVAPTNARKVFEAIQEARARVEGK